MLKIAFDPIYEHPLPEGHRFPMLKYRLLPEQLIHQGTVTEAHFFRPGVPDDSLFTLAHDMGYLNRMNSLQLTSQEMRKIGFPLSQGLIDREKVIANGTWLCAEYALEYGIAMNIAGGTHHAFWDRGEGFCMLNDMAVAATQLIDRGKASHVLVIDLDVHQGNGTAQIFKDEGRVFTFSMHGAHNYPAQKEKSDWDISLPNGTEDLEYLTLLKGALSKLMQEVKPDFIFYQAGVDVLASDKLGKLSLTLDGCQQRDKLVLETSKKHQVPLVVCMGGGYSERVATIIEAHAATFRLAQEVFF
jgi:acetoin utilization deacetylase AcuC-like enzyme